MLGLGKKENIAPVLEENDDIMDLSGEDFTEEPRIYEVSYLIVPGLTEEVLTEEVTKIKTFLAKEGAETIMEGPPKKLSLAYPMRKSIANRNIVYTEAFFGWIKFTLAQTKISEVKTELDKKDTIVRFLILKTTRETSVVAKLTPRRIYKKRDEEPKVTKEESVPVNEVELDKEIEGLLIS